ncbi:MAG TPA: glycosyltransferase family 2 protein [Chitinophagaceae bacterium]|nr:glycosyltransferase family 2 protein [Chitinophagaceae bacterium]
MVVVYIIFWFLFINLSVGTAYLLVIALAGRFGRLPGYPTPLPVKKRIAVIIPSYKEDNIIVHTAQEAAAHNYPKDYFQVLVVADKLQPETVAALRQIPVQVLEVDANMKSRSVNAAFGALSAADFDIAMILDADNVMEANCLEKVNAAFANGAKAVQCHRTAKNQHTPVAVLDAISEEININLFRRGPAVLNISAAPIGSGMAFEFGLLKDIFSLEHILNNPGEDREIDTQLMIRGVRMQFIEDAYVYDEKVASSGVFEKQRVRWLEAQVNHVKRFFHPDMAGCPRGVVYYNKFYQNLLLPRLLFIMLFCLLAGLLVLQWLLGIRLMAPAPIWWMILMGAYALVLIVSVPGRFYNGATLRAVLHVPSLMIAMVKALLKIKSGRKEFLHTPKTYTSE